MVCVLLVLLVCVHVFVCAVCVDPQLLVLRASIPVDGIGRYANVDIIVGDAIMYKTVQVVVYWICLLFNAHCCRKIIQSSVQFLSSLLY